MTCFQRFVAVAAILLSWSGLFADAQSAATLPPVAVASQYGTTHVYVKPEDIDAFVRAFLGTLGGASTKQVVVTVTPTPSTTTSQLLQTPVGTVSLFSFLTPFPFPFGSERNGYLVANMDTAVSAARSAGADVVVKTFPDPIDLDAIVQWPGGATMQLYWHKTAPHYSSFVHMPENRVYVSPDGADVFLKSFLNFFSRKDYH